MLIELDWSEQSPHIRSLFHPWRPGDGYDEEVIQAAEARLGIRLPAMLRNFYAAWGRRRDTTQVSHHMLNPDELVVRADTLIFWVENQAVVYWGVQSEALAEDDPAVVVTYSGPSGWDVESELNWMQSHAHLSSFLDDLIYQHAFAGGAVYGGSTDFGVPLLSEEHIVWLEEKWHKATVGPLFLGFGPDSTIDRAWPTLYVREGQAFFQVPGGFVNGIGPACCLAAREAEALDEISQRFQIKWHIGHHIGKVNNLLEIKRPELILTWLTDPPHSQRMWI